MDVSTLRGIIFDWHGVLDETTYRGFSTLLARITGRCPVELRAVVSPQERLYVAGKLPPEAFWAFLREALRLEEGQLSRARAHLLAVRLHCLLWVKIPSFAKRFRLGVLSDCPADKLVRIRDQVDLSMFAATSFSCEQERGKESETFFLALCRRLDCTPPDCLYVDDTDVHVATAARLGFRTYRFGSADGLEQCVLSAREPTPPSAPAS